MIIHCHYLLAYRSGTVPNTDYDGLKKRPENVEYFNCFGSMVTNDAKCTREIKSRIAMAKEHSTGRRLFSAANWA
jgi:hypothetical protein